MSVAMSVAIYNYHSEISHSFLTTRCQQQYEIAILLPLDVSSNVKLPFLTTRCQQHYEIAILHHQMSVAIGNYILDHQMSVPMRNCHSLPLDVSSNVKLPFLTTRCQQHYEIVIFSTRCQQQCEICQYAMRNLLHQMSVAMWRLTFLTTRCQQHCEIAILDHQMSVAIGNYYSQLSPLDVSTNEMSVITIAHSLPLDVSSNVELPTTRCQQHYEIVIFSTRCQQQCEIVHLLHQMSVAL